MTEANRRPATGDHSNVPTTPARHPAPQMRPTNGTTPDPREIAARALEGLPPATESWFTTSNARTNPEQPRPRYTPYAPGPQAGQTPAPQGMRHPDARFYQSGRPAPQRPMPSPAQLPQHAYRPHPYTAQQPPIHPARPLMYANPAMPPYAAAQAPAPRGSMVERQPEPADRGRNKKVVLLPLAAMAIASAAVGAFAQANLGSSPDFASQTQQVKAQVSKYDAVPAIEYLGDQDVISAPDVIVPEDEVSPAVARATAGGKHSNGNYDAPSTAQTYGGAHASGGTFSAPSGGGDTSADPAPAPAPEPQPEPAPSPDPEPEPEPEPDEPSQPTLGDNVINPTLDTTAGVVGTLTGIEIDLTR